MLCPVHPLLAPVVLVVYPQILGVLLGAVIVGVVILHVPDCAVPFYVVALVHVHVIAPVLVFFVHPLGVDNALVPFPFTLNTAV